MSELATSRSRSGAWFSRFSRPSRGGGRRLPLLQQLLLQLVLGLVALTVLYPVLWILSLSFDPTDNLRPTELRLIPPGASVRAYEKVIEQPTPNPVSFWRLAFNSLRLSGGVALGSVAIAVTAAYAFSRLRFKGRQVLMLTVLTVLMLPSIATLAALFVLLNRVQIPIGDGFFNLRNSLWGVGLAVLSTQLPFAIWNLKGYLDTIPRELEEAAVIDGCTVNQAFLRVTLPLSVPALAVTAFLGFMSTWSEFAISWQFLTNPQDFTLTMSLYNMVGQYAGSVPWSRFAAMAILIALPVSAVYLYLQKYILSGLTIGSVKG